jgi:hypothetical protein
MTGAHGSARTPNFDQARSGQDGHPLKGDVLSVHCPPLLAGGHVTDMSRHVTSCPHHPGWRSVRVLAGSIHAAGKVRRIEGQEVGSSGGTSLPPWSAPRASAAFATEMCYTFSSESAAKCTDENWI